jgi:isoleucyl-tRNA synthetase
LRLVSLGSAVRNLKKIKVRQPLAELKIQTGDKHERSAVTRFGDQIREEQNLKRVTLHDSANGPLLDYQLKANMKNLGPKFPGRAKEVQTALASADAPSVVEKIEAGETIELQSNGETFSLAPDDVIVEYRAPDAWVGLADRDTQLALDTRITEELELEGLAREVVRHVQSTRKDADLALEDRIVLYLKTDADKLRRAIAAHRDYIAQECLVSRWAESPLEGAVFENTVKIEGMSLTIQLVRDADYKST